MDFKNRVPRNWENLPSMAMVPVSRGFSYSELARTIAAEAPDKELVCLVNWGWTTSAEKSFHQIDLLYEFADDPKLVLMRFLAPIPGQEQLIIRASFMRNTASTINASNLFDLAQQLSALARIKGFSTRTIE